MTHDGTDAALRDRARELSTELHLPIASAQPGQFDLLLVVRPDRLELRDTQPAAPGPIYADFLGSRPAEYRRRAGNRKQPLARAVGLPDRTPTVVDATAGLGRDAFRLAMLGCRVTAIERSPVVGALLRDGLRRARTVPELEDLLDQRLTLLTGDARDHLAQLSDDERPDVVYLDPMFPVAPNASALTKKEMRVFHLLVGDDGDADSLARAAARHRVVVKRMSNTPTLGGEPDICYPGKIARYDVYLRIPHD